MRNKLRKMRHVRYVNLYLSDLRWEVINLTIAASAVGSMTPEQSEALVNMGHLIRKYERRQRLLKF